MSGTLPAPNTYTITTIRAVFKKSNFTKVKRIGKGTEAFVFKGCSGNFGNVAIKVITQPTVMKTADMKEIDLLVKHSGHPNIVNFFGILASETDDSLCKGYVMEFMPMGCLDSVIHDFSITYDEKQVASWFHQICLGLGHLHREGIIHRDIKPKNLLLGTVMDVLKISDFGTARRIDDSTNVALTEGAGTILYMAPEVLQKADNKLNYTFSADIYSLAITFWEITRRKVPYSHLNVGKYEMAGMIMKGERPEKLSSLISSAYDHLIESGWDSEPNIRPNIMTFLNFSANRVTLFSSVAEPATTDDVLFNELAGDFALKDPPSLTRPRMCLKVVLFGSISGKTTLVRRYITGLFNRGIEPATIGCNREVREVDHDNQKIAVEMWDTSGIERTVPIYLRIADIILICYSITEPRTLQDVESFWLPEIVAHRPLAVPVVLVGLCRDLRDSPSNRNNKKPLTYEEGKCVAVRIGATAFFECSALLNEGVDELFKEVVKIACENRKEANEEKKKSTEMGKFFRFTWNRR